MLRLKSIKPVHVFDQGESERPNLEITFEGPAGAFGHCEITLIMKDRGTDVDQLHAAHSVLRDAIAQLNEELAIPTQTPETF
jgi:hypothetical protein